jgi:hypothetical protein
VGIEKTTHKARMLNAYRGIYSDCIPVSPEFWCYYPAKILGVDMVTFEREIPHWEAMRTTFLKYDADGWCVAGGEVKNPHMLLLSDFKKISDDRYRDQQTLILDNIQLTQTVMYDKNNPSWVEGKHIAENDKELDAYINAALSEDISFDFAQAENAHRKCGDDILVEYALGETFFDFVSAITGFENGIMLFMDDNDALLEKYRERFTAHKLRLLHEAAENTSFESFFIGCCFSCNSLLGPELWRKWDKPFLKIITAEAHRLGKLVHCHNHGKIMDTVPDLAEIGFDCVCPFERPPGDVTGLAELRRVRRELENKVAFNGNVSTVTALINGGPEDVRREVQEIKEAFAGTPRLIIGTGDQVGGETPEENIYAMIEEGRKT